MYIYSHSTRYNLTGIGPKNNVSYQRVLKWDQNFMNSFQCLYYRNCIIVIKNCAYMNTQMLEHSSITG